MPGTDRRPDDTVGALVDCRGGGTSAAGALRSGRRARCRPIRWDSTTCRPAGSALKSGRRLAGAPGGELAVRHHPGRPALRPVVVVVVRAAAVGLNGGCWAAAGGAALPAPTLVGITRMRSNAEALAIVVARGAAR